MRLFFPLTVLGSQYASLLWRFVPFLSFKKGFPHSSAGKESACSAGDLSSIPGLGRYPGEGKGYPLQYSGLENSMDCIVHRVTKSRTRLSYLHFLVLRKAFLLILQYFPFPFIFWSFPGTPISWMLGLYVWGFSGLVVKNPPANEGDTDSIPWSGKVPWRRKWQPTPAFSPGKSHGQRSLGGYSPWSCRESDMT